MTTLEDIQYVLNAVGNRTSMTDSAGTTSWTYDSLDRLTNVSYPNGNTTVYGYDAVGNRISHTINGAAKTNTFDQANRMTASGSDTYTYNANGSQTSRTSSGVTTTYGYDALDRLVSISGPVTASYAYNGDDLRVAKTVSGTTTTFIWDMTGLSTVIGDGTSEYVRGLGLIGQVTGATATYAHGDALGSVRLTTNGTGAVTGTRQYDAFGTARSTTGTQLPFTYTGEQEDTENGLIYLRARYYNHSTGRFVTRDAFSGMLSAPDSQHGYTYVNNSPMQFTDPSGLCTVQIGAVLLPDATALAVFAGFPPGTPIVHLAIRTVPQGPRLQRPGAPSVIRVFEGRAQRGEGSDLLDNSGNLEAFEGDRSEVEPDITPDWEDVCVVADDPNCEKTNEKLRKLKDCVNRFPVPYNIAGPNSNAFASEAVRAVGGRLRGGRHRPGYWGFPPPAAPGWNTGPVCVPTSTPGPLPV